MLYRFPEQIAETENKARAKQKENINDLGERQEEAM